MDIQSLIPPALYVLHNFICHYDPDDIDSFDSDIEDLVHGSMLKDGLGELV